ncbi:UNVERIFIED_CONTAM: Mitochondrial outer membrane protein porin of [Sesamum indicum]
MITLADVYHVIIAIIPLYVAMIAAYLSIKWWKLFTPDQCAGINKFVANFSIPLLSFQVISSNNPYRMNLKLVSADFLQKLLALIVLAVIAKLRSRGNLSWVITGLSLSTLPNTLILGIPLIRAMYGEEAAILLAQIVVLQSLIWYNLLLILFEIDATEESINMTSPSEVTGELEGPQGPERIDGDKEGGRFKNQMKRNIRIILLTVGKKLIRNPNTHATLAGLIWASIHFRWGVKLPKVIQNSVSLLSDGGLGMAMFSLGLFMASQARVIACGTRKAVLAMAMKFLAGPFLMAVPSVALGLRGTLLKVAIVQAALPQGIVPFVFAKEYNLHPDVLSTGSNWISILLPAGFVRQGYEIMGKGPGLYSDIGKRARDLLYRDYQSDHKFTITTYSPTGVTLTSTGIKKGDLFLADVNTQLKHKNVTTDIKVDTSSNLLTTVTVDEPAPGLKTILSFRVPDQRSGKLELQYLHDYAGISSSVGLTANPIVNFSAVLGSNKLAVGSDVSFDSKEGAITKCNFGASFTNSDLIAALTLNDKGDTLSASYYHTVNPLTNTAVGAEVTHSFSSNENTITVGTQHSLDPLTMVKARVNNFGKASALIQHEWRPKSLITVSTEVDTKSIDKSAKFGVALALKP